MPSRRVLLGWSARLVARRQEEGEVTEVRLSVLPAATGYSGAPSWRGSFVDGEPGEQGLNNPDMEPVTNVGPVPEGRYTIGHLQ